MSPLRNTSFFLPSDEGLCWEAGAPHLQGPSLSVQLLPVCCSRGLRPASSCLSALRTPRARSTYTTTHILLPWPGLSDTPRPFHALCSSPHPRSSASPTSWCTFSLPHTRRTNTPPLPSALPSLSPRNSGPSSRLPITAWWYVTAQCSLAMELSS